LRECKYLHDSFDYLQYCKCVVNYKGLFKEEK